MAARKQDRSTKKASPEETLVVRHARRGDVANVISMMKRAYPTMSVFTSGHLLGQITAFPEGQFVAEYDNKIVGYAATFRIDEATALSSHNWAEITGGGYASRHDPLGNWLYGMEVCVDPDWRGLRIGQRLYEARKRLAEELELNGIVFGGRMPGLSKNIGKLGSAEAYLEAVKTNKIQDVVTTFQINNGFEPIGLLKDYLPSDKESMGYAAHLVWRNPYVEHVSSPSRLTLRPKDWVRVATVQFQQRAVSSFEEFISNIEYFVDVVSDYKSDFVVFPELFTLQLLALEKKRLGPMEAIEALTRWTKPFTAAMRDMALSYNINIIGGSHPTKDENGEIKNIAYVFLRDGSVHAQEKIHPTPNERNWWNIKGGNFIRAIDTDCGPIGVLVCYDSEFPELARRLSDEGAKLLFVPFCTDNRQGYLRVRYCSQARAIENQCYVILAGNVGNLPGVENMDVQYAQSCILTPCDFPFARDGIAAEASENVETIAVADLDLSDLAWARRNGTVRNLRDRRFDLYRLVWQDDPKG
jgi:predicted amidohydrolase/GNAT superfamily N-acetyltransferase